MIFKSAFIALLGRPNVGKSTLLNTLLNQKIAITTHKPQTTRNVIKGILTDDAYQFVFLDTPGIHQQKNEFSKFLNKQAFSSLRDADVFLYLLSLTNNINDIDFELFENISKNNKPIIILLTKRDKVSLEVIQTQMNLIYEKLSPNVTIIPIDNYNQDDKKALLKLIYETLPNEEGIKFFPDNEVTDQPEYFLIKEIIREKVLLGFEQEVPHSVAITIDSLKRSKKLIKIIVSIYVERKSQKGILIGNKGAKLKEIGTKIRLELEQKYQTKVFIDIMVKLEQNWRKKESLIKKMGYTKDLY